MVQYCEKGFGEVGIRAISENEDGGDDYSIYSAMAFAETITASWIVDSLTSTARWAARGLMVDGITTTEDKKKITTSGESIEVLTGVAHAENDARRGARVNQQPTEVPRLFPTTARRRDETVSTQHSQVGFEHLLSPRSRHQIDH
eukprot:CAMPEP_0168727304 /NCGR_PEP_ID=MMETSP0724-20121128/5110_1 /TAXON_ID=265536 /ORGANISM="Amphiprora sp., Strain CCMP467" /LENGTH=144 /DNA_ID=CAMNT_0008774135 /DNA_START=52 /DNA_END=484 /DNA_ORIENTATION=-